MCVGEAIDAFPEPWQILILRLGELPLDDWEDAW